MLSTSSRTAPRRFRSGTRIVREWKGKVHEVTITDGGFEYKGETFKSLSPIACRITGHTGQVRLLRTKGKKAMKTSRCAIYTRKSSEEGLDSHSTPFMPSEKPARPTLQARSTKAGTPSQPSTTMVASPVATWFAQDLRRLLEDIAARQNRLPLLSNKVDRLTRSLADFAKIVETLTARESVLSPSRNNS